MSLSPSPARWVAALLLLLVGGAHVPLVPQHLEEAPYMGVLFIALAVACLVLATLILVRGAQLEWVLGGAICLAAIVAFMLSRTVGLPQMGDDIGNWTEPWSFPALAAEALMALLAAEHLGSRRSRLNRHPEQAVLPAPGSLSPRPPE